MKSAVMPSGDERHTDGARMAKRGNDNRRSKAMTMPAATTTPNGGAATSDPLEQRVVAFAEQLGRIVGTVQAKAEGWMDRDALNKQLASVRDNASELLDHMKTSVTSAMPGGKSETQNMTATPAASAAAVAARRARSGGVVDAPGKKHRKAAPKDARAMAADARAMSMRSSRASMKSVKRRGRG